MIYQTELTALPVIRDVYTVTRKTVWEITDPYHILIAIKEGACTVECAGETYDLTAGDLFFIPALTRYTRRPKDDLFCTMTYVHFTLDGETTPCTASEAAEALGAFREALDRSLLGAERPERPKNPLFLSSRTREEGFSDAVFAIEETALKTRVESHLSASTALAYLLARMTEATLRTLPRTQGGVGARTPKKLRRAILYIRQNFLHPISLDDLAAYSGVSKQQLIRTFRTEIGTTPGAYITGMRMDRAKEIFLTQPHLSVKEVSAELGFEDQHYFTRVFAKETGETPTAYRYRVTHYQEK